MGSASAEGARNIITVAGCKGGVGKSVISAAIALELGRLGHDVIAVDADLGGANLHTYLGIQAPKYVISDFLSRRVATIEGIVLETDHEGVRFISSAGNAPGQANPKYAQKMKIINGLHSLKADFLIVDIGAGSSYDVMDFFLMTDEGILVTIPEPTSIINSYGFMKNVIYRKLSTLFRQYPLVTELIDRGMNPDGSEGISAIKDVMTKLEDVSPDCWLSAKTVLAKFAPKIIVNMTTSESEAQLGEKLSTIIGKYLSIYAKCLGEVREDPALRAAAKKMKPYGSLPPESEAVACIKAIVQRLLRSVSSPAKLAEVEAPMSQGEM